MERAREEVVWRGRERGEGEGERGASIYMGDLCDFFALYVNTHMYTLVFL